MSMQFLATGINRHATAAGSMLEKVTSSTSRMTAQDRAAIATYLKSLPPQNTGGIRAAAPRTDGARPRPLSGALPDLPRRRWQPRADGATAGYPSLAGDTLVMGRDPTTVLRIILTGGTAPPAAGPAADQADARLSPSWMTA